MSIWSDISDFLSSIVADAFSTVVESVRTVFSGDTETRKRVAFSVALIALSAKMAKADGVVTEDEIDAFREVFHVPDDEIANVARLYNLAKQDIAGFDSYSAQVRSLFPGSAESDADVLQDVLDALFHIAKADGFLHENELLFLEEVAAQFGFDAVQFDRIKLYHLAEGEADPYLVLGAQRDWEIDRIKAQYRKRVWEAHPDRMIARGVPSEFIGIANDRLATLNAAWELIESRARTTRKPEPATVS